MALCIHARLCVSWNWAEEKTQPSMLLNRSELWAGSIRPRWSKYSNVPADNRTGWRRRNRPSKACVSSTFDRPDWENPRAPERRGFPCDSPPNAARSEEHTSELQSRQYLVCRLLLEKKKPHELLT